MSHRCDSDPPSLRSARSILRGLTVEVRQGRLFGDGGPEWERIRLHAFRYFVLRPIFQGGRACLRGLAAVIGRRRDRLRASKLTAPGSAHY